MEQFENQNIGIRTLTSEVLHHYLDSELFFVELGAYDGIVKSNTQILEECIPGSNGLLIDGNPMIWHDETITFDTDMSTMSGISDVLNEGRGIKQEVHCGPLQTYLTDLDISRIALFSLDVEGAEMSVLKTIDFEATQIDIFLIEIRNRLCKEEIL